MRKQSGFTLLELMIVVAVIGILASIAIPAYQDYVVKTRISEGLGLTAAAKIAVTETWQVLDKMPASGNGNVKYPNSYGLPLATNIVGEYVTSVTALGGSNATGGLIHVLYNDQVGGNPSANGTTVTLSPTTHGGSIAWTCKTGVTGLAVNSRYLPGSCR